MRLAAGSLACTVLGLLENADTPPCTQQPTQAHAMDECDLGVLGHTLDLEVETPDVALA